MKFFRLFAVALLILTAGSRSPALGGETPLHAGDRISISIGAVPDGDAAQIRGLYTVGDKGTINLLHIGEIRAAGVKPSDLQRSIEQIYIAQEFYSHPTVLVAIDTPETPREIYVTGVLKPGSVGYKTEMTMSQAIMAAGGPGPFGKVKKVKLLRSGHPPTIHNLKEHMGDPAVDVILQPGDQIIIPEE